MQPVFFRVIPFYVMVSWLASGYMLRAVRRMDRISYGARIAAALTAFMPLFTVLELDRPVLENDSASRYEWIAWIGIGVFAAIVIGVVSVLVWIARRDTPRPEQPSPARPPGRAARWASAIACLLAVCAGAALLVASGVKAQRAPSIDEYSAGLAIVPQGSELSPESCPKELCEGHPLDSGERKADPVKQALQYATASGRRCWSRAPDGTLLARDEAGQGPQSSLSPRCFPAVVYHDAAHDLVFLREYGFLSEYGAADEGLSLSTVSPRSYAWRRTATEYEPTTEATSAYVRFLAPRLVWLSSSAFGLVVALIGLATAYAAQHTHRRRAAPGAPASIYREAEGRVETDADAALAQRWHAGSMLAVFAVVSTSSPLVVYWLYAW